MCRASGAIYCTLVVWDTLMVSLRYTLVSSSNGVTSLPRRFGQRLDVMIADDVTPRGAASSRSREAISGDFRPAASAFPLAYVSSGGYSN
jgi:hypothetical protein